MSENGSSFRFTWKVKNFSFLWHREHQFLKWTFNVKRKITTSWSLLLYPSTPKNCVSCVLRKESGDRFDFLLDYELSFLDQNGTPLHSIQVSGADFNSKSRSVQLWMHHEDISNYKIVSLSEDTLRICCKIWTAGTPILGVVRYFSETEIKVERCTLMWDIVALSGLKPGKKREKFILNPLTGSPCISFNLFLNQWNNFIFELVVLIPKLVELCKCEIFLLGYSGKKLKCGSFEVVTIGKTTDPEWKFPLSLTVRNLMENREQYLLNDTLTLQCEVAFASGIEAEPVQKLEPDSDNHLSMPCNTTIANSSTLPKILSEPLPTLKNDPQLSGDPNSVNTEFVSLDPEPCNHATSLEVNIVSNSKHLKVNDSGSSLSDMGSLQSLNISSSMMKHNSPPLSWKDDLLTLYESGSFCDGELFVASNFISVHSLILSIRSPVFCDFFTRAKRDGKKASMNIEDLDAGTVKKMVLFLYTDMLEDLDYNSAKSLYSASLKYEIQPLKDISSSFLKANLSTTNCCDVLLLLDKYKDDAMKQAVQDFIMNHDEVLNSDQWRSFEESYPRLIMETFRFFYQKLRKN